MLRRTAALVAATLSAGLLTTLTASPAAAADPVTLYTVDRTVANGNPSTSTTTYTATVAAATSPAGGLRWSSVGGVFLAAAPPAGQAWAAGSFPVASTQDATNGYLSTTSSQCSTGGLEGTATVDALTTDPDTGAVTSLAGSYDVHCTANAALDYAGVLRFASAAPYVRTTASVNHPLRTGVGTPATATVTFSNTGTADAPVGTAALSGTNAAEFAVGNDTCSGTTVAPAGTCTLDVTFTPAALGARTATLALPVTGHPRPAGQVVNLTGTAYAPPAAPAGLFWFETANGPGLAWQPVDGTPVSGYTLYRRADSGAPWDAVTTASGISAVDAALSHGTSAEYAVSASGYGGESALSDPLPVTRPASDPTPSAHNALALDAAAGSTIAIGAYDTATAGDQLSRQSFGITPGTVQVSAYNVSRGSGLSLTLPVLHPGSYTVAATPAAGEIKLNLSHGSGACWLAGTLTVTDVLYGADLLPTVLNATFDGTCGTTPVRVELRWGSDAPYLLTTVDPAQLAAAKKTGVAAADQTVTVTNAGTAPATMAAPAVDGPAAADWALVGTTCGGSLAPAASCTATLRFTPSALGDRSAVLHLPDGTSTGGRAVTLTGVGGDVPGAPPSGHASGTMLGVGLFWADAPHNNLDFTAYRVYRAPLGGTPALLASVSGTTFSYLDRTAAYDAAYTYSVAAVSDAGEGPRLQVAGKRFRTEVVLTSAGSFGEPTGLYVAPPGGGERFPLEVDGADHYSPAVSPDGRWVAYARNAGPGYDIWVRATDGTGTPRQLTSSVDDEVNPAWSPDGRTVAYEVWLGGVTPEVRTVPAAGGASTSRGDDIGTPSFLPDSQSLVVSDYTSDTAPLLRVGPTGARTAIAGTQSGYAPQVSPDGTKVAYQTYDGVADAFRIAVSPVDGKTARSVVTPLGADYWTVSWRADGGALYVENDFGIQYVPLGGGSLLPVNTGGMTPAFAGLGVAMSAPPAFTTSSPSLAFGVANPVAGTTFTCARDGGAAAACTSPWKATGLTAGSHTLVVTATIPGSTKSVAARTWTVDATAPTAITNGTPSLALNPAGGINWWGYDNTGGSGIASYDVRYRKATYSTGFGAYVYPASWQHTAAHAVSQTMYSGAEYCYSVRARDVAGNVSAWVPEHCLSRPLDDRSLTASSGWARKSSSLYYNGTYTEAAKSGVSLSLGSVTTKRVTLIVTKCASCGSIAVYVGATKIASVNLYSATTKRQLLVGLPVQTVLRTGTFKVVTTSGGLVQVDGVAFRRT